MINDYFTVYNLDYYYVNEYLVNQNLEFQNRSSHIIHPAVNF